jgi:hypothetical protein
MTSYWMCTMALQQRLARSCGLKADRDLQKKSKARSSKISHRLFFLAAAWPDVVISHALAVVIHRLRAFYVVWIFVFYTPPLFVFAGCGRLSGF